MSAFTGSVSIRALRHEDFDGWLRLWRGYQAFYKVTIPLETTRLTFERLLDDREPVAGAVATLGQEVVGLAHHILHRSTWTGGDYCYLQDLFTAEAARGKGVGGALIEHIYARAAEAGCSRVYWLTHETNAKAIRLYDRVAERSGFIQYRKAL